MKSIVTSILKEKVSYFSYGNAVVQDRVGIEMSHLSSFFVISSKKSNFRQIIDLAELI